MNANNRYRKHIKINFELSTRIHYASIHLHQQVILGGHHNVNGMFRSAYITKAGFLHLLLWGSKQHCTKVT